MKRIFACVGLFTILFITACGDIKETDDIKSFEAKLRGTWVPNDEDPIYPGTLEIDFDRITITGYSEGRTPSGESDDNRPFKNFTKGIPLKGYSEGEKLFIQDRGALQEGIPYTWYEDGPPPNYKKTKFLKFTFGVKDVILQSE